MYDWQFNQKMNQQQQNNALLQKKYEQMALQHQLNQLAQQARSQPATQQWGQPQQGQAYYLANMQPMPSGTAGNAGGMLRPSGNTSSGPQPDQALAQFKADYDRKKMENEMALWADQTKQGQIQTENLRDQASANQFKQNAWTKALQPGIQAMTAFNGLPGYAYGGMNNARLGEALMMSDQWALGK
jgi:hypothetical protein